MSLAKHPTAKKIFTASTGAREFVETPTFQEFVASEHPLWTVGGLAFLLHRNEELRDLVEGRARTVEIDDTIREAFRQYCDNRAAQFAVRLRRHRSEQLQELLSKPDSIDLGTFNRDVWTVWSSATLNGKDVTPLLSPAAQLSEDQLAELEAGLETGRLEVHGNCMWGSGTRIYGPMISGGDGRAASQRSPGTGDSQRR